MHVPLVLQHDLPVPVFDDGYVRVFHDVRGVGPVLYLYPRNEGLMPGEFEVCLEDPPTPDEVSRSHLARKIAEVALGDLLGVEA